MRDRFPAFAAVLVAGFLAALPAAAPAAEAPPQLPIGVTAESLVVEEAGALIRFEGKVVLKRGSLTLSCEKLVLRAKGGDPSQVKTGNAEGGVVLTREGDRAEAARAEFDLDAGKVVLTGSPFLVRGTDTIRGSRIVYTLGDGKAAVSGPVEATFTPTGAILPSPSPAPSPAPGPGATGAPR